MPACKIVKVGNKTFIEPPEGIFLVENEQDALDLAAQCGENNTYRLLLRFENFTSDFFDLKTGLAGSILQKFITYRIKVAAVIPSEKISGRFREMVIESNRGNHFRVFEKTGEASDWLIKT